MLCVVLLQLVHTEFQKENLSTERNRAAMNGTMLLAKRKLHIALHHNIASACASVIVRMSESFEG